MDDKWLSPVGRLGKALDKWKEITERFMEFYIFGCNVNCNKGHTFLIIFALVGYTSCLVEHENGYF